MKAFLVILLAAMTAWIAVTADEMEKAHAAAGRPAKVRTSGKGNPSAERLEELVRTYGARQVLLAAVGIVLGLILAVSVAMIVFKIIAIGCVAFLLFVLWQAWDRGYITAPRAEWPTTQRLSRLA
jgi:hypothetical protein